MSERGSRRVQRRDDSTIRWECHCQESPVLLGTYDPTGTVHIKARDRYWHVTGTVRTTCPRCGKEHALEPSTTGV